MDHHHTNEASADARPRRAGLSTAIAQRDDREAAKLLRDEAPELSSALLLELHPGRATAILDLFPADYAERVCAATPPIQVSQWVRNQAYPQGSVGRFMDPVYAVFPPRLTVGETIERLRELIKQAFITYGFIVDEAGRLRGVITMRDLLFAEHERTLEAVMIASPFSLDARMPLAEAMKAVLSRHYPVYPVCDGDGRLVGLVRGQVLFEEQNFEISAQPASMVGVEEERLTTPWQRCLKLRHPWLQFNLLTAFLAAAVVGVFQETLNQLVILALFLPVLAGQSGNTGCQALAVTLRGLTLGEVRPGRERALVAKEAWLGLLNGLLVGLVSAVGMYVTAASQHNPAAPWLALAILLAMVGSCVVSGISGAMIPLTLKRLGADPATASSIFLTTATDVASMGLFLGLATVLILW
ncbi:magnesium transporter [Hylemonella gracilis]|uniref:Mg2+/Co2+ transporter n=1 Tax=Hylemonella gracilis ATCC 19624 TaxID=887062 RepID=F3KR03_9BURK|nr:magnesium transporter [Hylemonella gracilis]EGI77704.1 Mg2+/Co2+ transporter [Hylemonella gracilis ATCC 19624]